MPLEVFYSYAHEDEDLRNELDKQLSLLKRSGLIVGWHDRKIGAGDEWRDQINAHLRSAQIILLLISADFLASDYCYDTEMKLALARHKAHEAVVIPIILRPVDWYRAPFARLQALPRDAKPVTTWANRDEAFADIARNVGDIVQRFASSARSTAIERDSPVGELVDGYTLKPRVLDAAIPGHIVKGRATELLVLIHLPESAGLDGVLLADENTGAKPEDVRSKPFKVVFPLGPDGRPEALKAVVKVTSPDFSPREQAKNLFIPPNADSEVGHFLLTPTKIGQLRVLVELQWQDALQGARSLRTECIAEAASAPAQLEMNVVRVPVAVSVEDVEETSASMPSFGGASTGTPRPGEGSRSDDDTTRSWRLDSGALDRSEVLRPYSEQYRMSRREAAPAPMPASAPRLFGLTSILVAVITAIPLILGSYWQFVYKPSHSGNRDTEVTFSGQVLDARTGEFVHDAQVTLALDGGAGPLERYTDSNGSFSLGLGKVKLGSQGRIYVHAKGFKLMEKNFVITDALVHGELRLEPVPIPPPPKPPRETPKQPVIEEFRVFPDRIAQGEKVKILWNVSGAERVEISPLSPGTFPLVGQMEDSPARDTTYTLSAFGKSAQQPVTKQASVSVKPDVAPPINTPARIPTKVVLKLRTILCFQDGSHGATNWYFTIKYMGSPIMRLGTRSYDDDRAESKNGITPPAVEHPEATIEMPETGTASIEIFGYRATGNRLSAQGNAIITSSSTVLRTDVVGVPEKEGHFMFDFTVARVSP